MTDPRNESTMTSDVAAPGSLEEPVPPRVPGERLGVPPGATRFVADFGRLGKLSARLTD